MRKTGIDSSLAELLNYLESEGVTSQEDLGKMFHESLEEVLEMTFGGEIASVLEGSLIIETHEKGEVFDPDAFAKNLSNTFGEDSREITMMLEGKMLIKYYHREMMKKFSQLDNL